MQICVLWLICLSGCHTSLTFWNHIAGLPELSSLTSGLKRVAALFFGRECTILRLRLVKDFAVQVARLPAGCSENLHALRGRISLRVP